MKFYFQKQKGMTVMVMMIVVLAICVATTICIFFFHTWAANKRDQARKDGLAAIQKAIDLYYKKFGHYPIGESFSTDAEWGTEASEPIGNPLGALVKERYLEELPQDPVNAASGCTCGNGYRYYYCHYEPGTGQTCVRDASDSETLSHGAYHLSTCLERQTGGCRVISGGIESAIGNYSVGK